MKGPFVENTAFSYFKLCMTMGIVNKEIESLNK
jgi:hypothetical protein